MATKQESPLTDAMIVFMLLACVAFILLVFHAAQLP
jgi:hypothetical protein